MTVIEVKDKRYPTKEELAAVEEHCRQFMHETFTELGIPEESRKEYIWSDWWQKGWARTWLSKGEDVARAEAASDVRRNVERVNQGKKARELVEGASERVCGDRKKYMLPAVRGHVERLMVAGGGLPLSTETAEKIRGYLDRKMAALHDEVSREEVAGKLVDECFEKCGVSEKERWSWRWSWGDAPPKTSAEEKLKKESVEEVRAYLLDRIGKMKSSHENAAKVKRLIQDASDRGGVDLVNGRDSYEISTTVKEMIKEGGGLPLSTETAEKIKGYLDHEVWRIESRDERRTSAREMTSAARERAEEPGAWNHRAEQEVYRMLGERGVTREDVEAYLDQEVVAANARHEREIGIETAIEAARAGWGIPVEYIKTEHHAHPHAWWKLTNGLREQWKSAEARGASLEEINAMARAYLDKRMEVISDSLLIDKLAKEAIAASPLPDKDKPSEWKITADATKVAETMRDFFELVPDARKTYEKGAVLRTRISEKVAGYAEVALRKQLVSQAYDKYRIPQSLRQLHDHAVDASAKKVAGSVERFFEYVPGGRPLYDRSEIIAGALDQEVGAIARALSVSPEKPSVDAIRERVEQEFRYRRENIFFAGDARRVVSEVLLAFRVPTDTWGVDNPEADPRRQALDKITEAILPACQKIQFDLTRKEGGRYLKEEKKVQALCDQLAGKIHTEVNWDLRVGKYAPQKAIQNPGRHQNLGHARPQTYSMGR